MIVVVNKKAILPIEKYTVTRLSTMYMETVGVFSRIFKVNVMKGGSQLNY